MASRVIKKKKLPLPGFSIVIESRGKTTRMLLPYRTLWRTMFLSIGGLVVFVFFALANTDSLYSDAQSSGPPMEAGFQARLAYEEIRELAYGVERVIERQRRIHALLSENPENPAWIVEPGASNALATIAELRAADPEFLVTSLVHERIRRHLETGQANLSFADAYLEALRPIPHRWPLPVDRLNVTSPFGSRRRVFYDPWSADEFHKGIDLGARTGDAVVSTAEGIVEMVGWDDGYGRMVIVRHPSGYSTLYGHMNRTNVRKSQYVEPGHLIGWAGSTGYATGPHLHYEVLRGGKPLDPAGFLAP